jgi:hypothetical protein
VWIIAEEIFPHSWTAIFDDIMMASMPYNMYMMYTLHFYVHFVYTYVLSVLVGSCVGFRVLYARLFKNTKGLFCRYSPVHVTVLRTRTQNICILEAI